MSVAPRDCDNTALPQVLPFHRRAQRYRVGATAQACGLASLLPTLKMSIRYLAMPAPPRCLALCIWEQRGERDSADALAPGVPHRSMLPDGAETPLRPDPPRLLGALLCVGPLGVLCREARQCRVSR